MPTISIVTTAYKHEKYIQYTIDSILHQSFSDWELLIWDDSPDNATWDIIQKYTKKYPDKIKAWHHHPNKGIVDNMNFLIEKSHPNSQYIAFLEWDDLYTPDNLEKKLHIFNQYSEVQMVYNNLDFIDGEGKVFEKDFLKKTKYYIRNKKISPREFFSHHTWYGSFSSLMFHKNILIDLKIKKPNSDLVFSVSDWDLFFRTVTSYHVFGLSESLTLYRRHGNNFSDNTMKIFEDLRIQMDYYLQNKIVSTELYKRNMSLIFLYQSVSFLEKWNRIASFQRLRQSLWNNLFSYPVYKVGIMWLLLLPKKLQKYILSRVIARSPKV